MVSMIFDWDLWAVMIPAVAAPSIGIWMAWQTDVVIRDNFFVDDATSGIRIPA